MPESVSIPGMMRRPTRSRNQQSCVLGETADPSAARAGSRLTDSRTRLLIPGEDSDWSRTSVRPLRIADRKRFTPSRRVDRTDSSRSRPLAASQIHGADDARAPRWVDPSRSPPADLAIGRKGRLADAWIGLLAVQVSPAPLGGQIPELNPALTVLDGKRSSVRTAQRTSQSGADSARSWTMLPLCRAGAGSYQAKSRGIAAVRSGPSRVEDLWADRLPQIDRLTDLSEEGGIQVPLGQTALLLRLVQGGGHPLFGPRRPDGLPGADGGARHERHGDNSCGRQRHAVPSSVLREPIPGRRRAGLDRLVGQVAHQVSRKPVGRLVSPGAVLLQALHHDPVELAAQRN